MKTQITDDYVTKQLHFGLQVAMILDELAKHENDMKTVQTAISFMLMELGFDQVDSYAAAVFINMAGMGEMINQAEAVVTLPALVCSAAQAINAGNIPEFVKEQVRLSLAK